MKLLRIMYIEIKKSIRENSLLSFILLISIIISCSVFIHYNDSRFSDSRDMFNSHLKQHSIEIRFVGKISYDEAENIIDILNTDFCEYILLSCRISTNGQPYSLSSASTLISVNKDPYKYIYSSSNAKPYNVGPERGSTYLSTHLTTGYENKGLYDGGAVQIGGREYIIEDFGAIWQPIEVLMNTEDFKTLDAVNRIVYSFHQLTSMSEINDANEKIVSLHPDAIITVTKQEQDIDKEFTAELMVLFFACIVNYCLIFTYLAGKRYEDYTVMRLFGIRRLHVMLMLMTELIIYNAVAFILSMSGFIAYWHIASDTDIIIHLYDSLSIVAIFFAGSLVIGAYNVIKMCFKMPIAYKNNL